MTRHGGEVFKTTGDGFLAEFASSVGALRCGIELQRTIAADRTDPTKDVLLRIGINAGDVMMEEGDVFGQAVNIAARLESIAEPGGICISETVYDQTRGRFEFAAQDRGERVLKNIPGAVRAWAVTTTTNAPPVAESDPATTRLALALTSADKPSIAVLAFTNMSGDPEQEYFADGLTEDILTGLTRFAQLRVIARNSSFYHKGRAVPIADIASVLNVRYIVEGSVRRAGDRVRVTAQLIEAANSAHLWAERYDRAITDIFAVQDEITERIVTTLVSNIQRSIVEQARRKPPRLLGAYELFLQGREQRDTSRHDGMLSAEALFERAIALDLALQLPTPSSPTFSTSR